MCYYLNIILRSVLIFSRSKWYNVEILELHNINTVDFLQPAHFATLHGIILIMRRVFSLTFETVWQLKRVIAKINYRYITNIKGLLKCGSYMKPFGFIMENQEQIK